MAGETQAQSLRAAQIVVSTLLVGVIVFAIVAVFLRPSMGERDEEQGHLLLGGLCAVAVMSLPVYGMLRKSFIKSLARRLQDARAEVRNDQIPPEAFALTIVGAALVEGLGLFGSVIFLITGEWYALAAPALAVILIGVLIPGREGIERLLRIARERA